MEFRREGKFKGCGGKASREDRPGGPRTQGSAYFQLRSPRAPNSHQKALHILLPPPEASPIQGPLASGLSLPPAFKSWPPELPPPPRHLRPLMAEDRDILPSAFSPWGAGQLEGLAYLLSTPCTCAVCACVDTIENLLMSWEGWQGLNTSAHARQVRGRRLGSKWLTCPKQGSGGTLW